MAEDQRRQKGIEKEGDRGCDEDKLRDIKRSGRRKMDILKGVVQKRE